MCYIVTHYMSSLSPIMSCPLHPILCFLQNFPWELAALPIIAAFIGWITNIIAIKMLFHPREEKRFFGLRIQGVFPKRQRILAKKLGEIVARELFSMEDLSQRLEEKINSPETQKLIGDKIEEVLLHKLPNIIPMVGMFLNQELVRLVRSAFEEDLTAFLKHFSERIKGELEGEVQVQAIVEEKVTNFSSDKFEAILLEIMRREFRFIEVIGAILGFMIGLVQVLLVYLP